MSADLLARIERDLCKIGEEIWNIDGPDDVVDKVLERLSLLKAQLEVQKSLQATANLLRRVPSDKALPKQQATKVKHLVRFAFRKNSRQELLERGKEGKEGKKDKGDKGDKEGRHQKLRKLDCDALKLCGLSYTTEEIVKLGDAEFEILQKRAEEFICHRNLSYLLYRPDVDKAIDSKLEDPEDDESFDKFMQSHTARRLSIRKRKYDAIASPNEAAQAPTEKKTNTNTNEYDGDAFIVDRHHAREALDLDDDEHLGEVWLTIRKKVHGAINENISFLEKKRRAFITIWMSEVLGEELGKRSRPFPMIDCTSNKEVQPTNNGNIDVSV
ncbi:uncharacterized protein PV06_10144 [Exophiala oligosperma]|uniref:Uncharacterized protein n=1 Tax=Exophiala oligosperma TaxID=215243 RepID=A0A0D2D4N4_9EURO|nr:uncharacterized protein PV06_10144 [Exophiala oligosperma]KIW38198.1 hypothetical protein PV06_10144 [Exophiala oligosperma]